MPAWNVLLAGYPDSSEAIEAMRRRLASLGSCPQRVELSTTDATGLCSEDLRAIDLLVLLVSPRTDRRSVHPLLATLEDQGVSVMLLTHDGASADHYAYAKILVEDASCDDAVLGAKLDTLLHCRTRIQQLRREMQIAQRFHGGLEGEIVRMHEELQLAAMVQREFLPRELPTLYGVSFGALWRPAHYVSGDIYDITRLDHDHVGVFIADAVGHGVPAALMTMVICRSLRTKVITGNSYEIVPPSKVLAHLNHEMIIRQGRTTRFATAVYAVVDCRNRTMTLAGAGHPPPFLLAPGGEPRLLETTGGLLGVFDDETYDQIEVELDVHDRLVLYSDGFEQAFPREDADHYGRKLPTTRYRDEFRQLASERSPDAMICTIGRRIDDQLGSLHQVDDLTLICMVAGALTDDENAPVEPGHAHNAPPMPIP